MKPRSILTMDGPKWLSTERIEAGAELFQAHAATNLATAARNSCAGADW